MKKNRAIWVALVVVAAAAALMFLVVLPQLRDDKAAEELARKAQETAEQAKQTVEQTVDTAKEATKNAVGETVADAKAGALAKVARLKTDAATAASELQSLLDGARTPTAEEITAAKAKVVSTLKATSEFKAPEGVDAVTSGMIAQLKSGASRVLSTVEAMPTDAEGARKVFETAKANLDAAVSGQPVKAEKPAAAAGGQDGARLPAFDVLRVEPDGSTVIAGTAEPNTKLDVMDGDRSIASVDVGATGDFAAVLDNPLPAGDHQLTLRATAKDGKAVASDEIATVSVPKDKSGELLAMVTKPGEASRIMTMPKSAEGTPQATAAGGVKTPELPAGSTDLSSSAPAVEVARTPDASAQNTAGKVATVVPAGKPEVQVSAVEIEGDKLFVAGAAKANSVVRVYADDKLVAEVTVDKNGRFVADNVIPLAVGNHTIRADVLTADGARVEFRASVPFFRPEGEQLAAVASDDASNQPTMTPLADGAYDKAREEAGKAIGLLKGLYQNGRTPDIDELAAARSATELALKSLAEIHLPADADQTAREIADKTSTDAAKALALLKALPQDAAAVKDALGQIDVAVATATAPAMQASANEKKTIEQASAETKPGQAAGSEAAGSAVATDTSGADEQEQAMSQSSSQTSQTAHANAGTDVASTEDKPKVIEQAPLTPSQSSVIIRRGDTLWQISRRVYGKGVRYTTIYLANEDQINDPDRILPGQVFGVPDKPLPNAEQLHRKRLGLQ